MKDNIITRTAAEELLSLLLAKEKIESDYLFYTEKENNFTTLSLINSDRFCSEENSFKDFSRNL